MSDANSKSQRVAIYCRVSTEDQRERQTIETQKEECIAFCERNGLSIIGYYLDDGVTGTLLLENRPQGARLLHDAGNNAFDTVVLYKFDRLAREPYVAFKALYDLKNLKVRLISATQPEVDPDTASGGMMFSVLVGASGFEYKTIIERSIAGTNRLAREGAWLGGIVPYGYRVEGKNRTSRLVISEDKLPGVDLSESEVIRMIYRLAADEKMSCFRISDRLNAFGVPPRYTLDGRRIERGKRKEETAAVWRPSRVRNMIVSPTYRGLHVYGKRSLRDREQIERQVPAIIDVDTWSRAQEVLRSNRILSKRNAKEDYLLRGLIKCGLCGLTYVGLFYETKNGLKHHYYRCNGAQAGRGVYAERGQRCPSKPISGEIEDEIWSDVERYVRNPGDVLDQLAKKMDESGLDADSVATELQKVERAIRGKEDERQRLISAFRRQIITENDLQLQLEKITSEQRELESMVTGLRERSKGSERVAESLKAAENLLRDLNDSLSEPLSFETKRALAEALVAEIRVDTVGEGSDRVASVEVTYRFTVAETRTDRGSWRRRE